MTGMYRNDDGTLTPYEFTQDTMRDMFNLGVKTATKLELMEQRLARIEREFAIQDRVLTELRRELALKRNIESVPCTSTVRGVAARNFDDVAKTIGN